MTAATGLLAVGMVWAQSDLSDASLEQLLNVKVTSVSKKSEDLAQTAAAAFVLGRDEIRRSGATDIPDLLRLVPGLDVAQIDSNTWAVGIRGFNSRFSNQLLVLIDGRSLYTTAFSGVYWDQIALPVEEIERIEVIRGPGAATWGVNAVNGVINIVTRSARGAHGGSATVSGGTVPRASGEVEDGGSAGNGGYRFYGQYSDTANSLLAGGAPAADAWQRRSGGFRADWDLSAADALTVEGDGFFNQESHSTVPLLGAAPGGAPLPQSFRTDGGSLLARWSHHFAGGTEDSLQAYYSAYHRVELGVSEAEGTFDLDFHEHRRLGARNDLVWGLGYRSIGTAFGASPTLWISPSRFRENMLNAFLQDEVKLAENWSLTVGSRFESDSGLKFVAQPQARLRWTPDSRQTLWASASRAVVQPSRADTSLHTDAGPLEIAPGLTAELWLYGSPNLKPPEVRDLEVGYRTQWAPGFSIDLVGFFSLYRNLSSLSLMAPEVAYSGESVSIVLPALLSDQAYASAYGGEAAANWQATEGWRLRFSYAIDHERPVDDVTGAGVSSAAFPEASPVHTVSVHSSVNLPGKVEFDQIVGYVSSLGVSQIPAHARVDVQLNRHFGKSLQLGVAGQNLVSPGFMEFGSSYGVAGTLVRRSWIGRLVWAF